MNEAKYLVKKITEGIQEKKGKNIVIADLSSIDDTICNYFCYLSGKFPQPSHSDCRLGKRLCPYSNR